MAPRYRPSADRVLLQPTNSAGASTSTTPQQSVLDELHRLRETFGQHNALVNGESLMDSVIQKVGLAFSQPEPTYALTEASLHTGYSSDHLGRLVRQGVIPNHGRVGRPRVKLSECPSRKRLTAAKHRAA